MTAKEEFKYILDHMGVVAYRDDEEQNELIEKGIAYVDQYAVRLHFFTGPQTYQNAVLKARQHKENL